MAVQPINAEQSGRTAVLTLIENPDDFGKYIINLDWPGIHAFQGISFGVDSSAVNNPDSMECVIVILIWNIDKDYISN